MSFSKYTKRRGQFEVLEAKQLFAADLMGGAATDLPDTPVVAGFDPGDLVAEFDPGDLYSVEMNPGDGLAAGEARFRVSNIAGYGPGGLAVNNIGTESPSEMVINDGLADSPRLGGQEGEPVMDPNDHLWRQSDGTSDWGQEGEPIMDPEDCPDFMLNGIARVENVSASPEAPDNLVPDTDCEFRIIGIAKGTQEE